MDSPGSSDWSQIAPPSPTTATDKLHEADSEYRSLLTLAQLSKYRYKRDYDELHKIHVFIHSNGERIMEEVHRTGPTEWLMTHHAQYFTTKMCKEREFWMRLMTEAKAVKKQVTTKLV